jgi:CubicO group peptidase (beta-lactamase class C family)
MKWLAAWLMIGCVTGPRVARLPTQLTGTDVPVTIAGLPTPLTEAKPGALREPLAAARAYAMSHQTHGWLVLRDGDIVDEAYAPGYGPDSVFNAGGMVNVVTALLVGRAIEDHRIESLDVAAATWLPEWRDDKRSRITVRHLVEMSSGLRNDHRPEPKSDFNRMQRGRDADAVALKVPSAMPAGFEYDANPVNTQILAILLSRIYDQPLPSLLSQRLWRPVGASTAWMALDRRGGHVKAYCCLFATARDWAKVGQTLLQEGRAADTQVVPEAWVRRMSMPVTTNPDYGLGVVRAEDGPGSRKREERARPLPDRAMFWLEGDGADRVYVMRHSRLVIVRFGDASPDWDDATIPNLLSAPAP